MTRRALLAAFAPNAAIPDWQALLARSITHDEDNFQLLRSYVFEVYDLSRAMRNLRETQSYEINLVGPGMYFRKLKHNDLPLSPEAARLEQTRLRTHLDQPAASDANAHWRQERNILKTWLESHQFEYKGRRTIDRRPALIIESKPPKSAPETLAFLSAARCRITLDEETGHWVEAFCDVQRRTLYSLNQLLLGRLSLPYSPGLVNRGDIPAASTLTIRLQRLEDGLWVPKYYRNERPGFLSELTFTKFRKFTSESQLLTDPQ
jgi:hypothetical protein